MMPQADSLVKTHHIFVHPQIPELVNLQEIKGQAKPYQIRQFLKNDRWSGHHFNRVAR